MRNSRTCIWCLDPNSENDSSPELLCHAHLAEYEGLSEDGMDRRDAEQYAEYADTLN